MSTDNIGRVRRRVLRMSHGVVASFRNDKRTKTVS